MDTILLAVFNSDTSAFDGLSALTDLHKNGDITLYGWAVIVKDRAGTISVKQAPEEGSAPLGAPLALLTGKLLEVLRGPAGLAIGVSLPGLTGFVFDLDVSRMGPKFLDDVAKVLTAGKAAVLAEVEESSTSRIDERLKKHGAVIFRRLPTQLIEDQLVRESAAFEAKLKALDQKLRQAVADNRAAIRSDIQELKKQRKTTHDQAKARLKQAKAEMGAKLKTLEDQAREVGDRAKARIERRMADLKADFDVRSKKMSRASAVRNAR